MTPLVSMFAANPGSESLVPVPIASPYPFPAPLFTLPSHAQTKMVRALRVSQAFLSS